MSEPVPPPVEPAPAPPPPPPLVPEKLSPTLVRTSLKAGRGPEVVAALLALSPVRRAELFVQLRIPEQKEILTQAPPELASSILSDCDSASLTATLSAIDVAPIAPALRLIQPDNLADILLHLPSELARKILDLLDPSLREEVQKLLAFDPETAGGLMTTRYLSVPDVVTIGRALELLRSAKKADGHSYIYVVDSHGKLVGVVPLRHLITANPRHSVRTVMVAKVMSVRAGTPKEEIVDLFNQYHYVSLPVVDEKDRLVGIVTSDDVLAAMRRGEEQVIRGVTGIDPREALKETLVAARGRIPWITVTILGGLGCAAIGGLFQRALGEVVVLGIFIPVVLAVGESIGAQTTSVVLSALVGGNVTRKEITSFLFKEFLIGLLVGVYSGVAVTLTSMLWHGRWSLGLLIGGAIFLSVSWAALLGVLIPTVMRRMRVNPAIASGPLVLTLADVSTLFIYFGGATLFLSVLSAP